jgi:hypothetical protein
MASITVKHIYHTIVHLFAAVGFFFTVVFVGMQFNIFTVKGSIASRNDFFLNATTTVKGFEDAPSCVDAKPVCDWNQTREWQVIKAGLEKDKEVINQVATRTNVPPRIIASVVVPEQLRFFSSSREVFKRYFEPLKILGSLTQFSLGVSGIKPETANLIEEHMVASTSPYYVGDQYATLLLYGTSTHSDALQYDRLTNEKDHHYSYLYTALFLKQIMAQWEKNGTPIATKPGVMATLFNLGFVRSIPKTNPLIGGATIKVGGKSYAYGEIGQLFFDSDELQDVFPR